MSEVKLGPKMQYLMNELKTKSLSESEFGEVVRVVFPMKNESEIANLYNLLTNLLEALNEKERRNQIKH